MTKTMICNNCGEKFEIDTKQYLKKYCSRECQTEATTRIKAWQKKLKAIQKEEEAKKNRTIDDVVREARSKNLNYGELVALETAKTVKVERRKRSGYHKSGGNA